MAQKNGIATRARKSGAARFSVTIRCFPRTRTPDIGVVSAPTMSSMKAVAGDCIFGSALRSNAALKFAAVTLWPVGVNLVFVTSTVKSYVFPPFEILGKPDAASGVSCDPFGPFASG